MRRVYLSFCFGVYNEEKILKSQVEKINRELKKILGRKNFEIIIVNNGSSDKTKSILKEINLKTVKHYSLKKKGLGLALSKAIKVANGDIVALSAVDLPFGFDDLRKALNAFPKYDLVFGSKSHPESNVYKNKARTITSFAYRILLQAFFSLSLRDTQGSIFIKKQLAKELLKKCDSKNAFFSTQIAIHSKSLNAKILEVPVHYKEDKNRVSKINVFSDGTKMLYSIITEFLMINIGKK